MGNLETILTVAILSAAAILVAWRLSRMVTSHRGACGGCSGACGLRPKKP